MRQIKDENEFKDIKKKGIGCIYNDFGSATGFLRDKGRLNNVLHKASCSYPQQFKEWLYYAENYEDAENWLDENREEIWRKCNGCL